jgi:hypothetical protein
LETARIPNHGEHHFLRLDSVPLSFRNLCEFELDELSPCGETE